MRLLVDHPTNEQRAALVEKLEAAGIPVYTSPRRGNSLWICLDVQYDDAIELLRNPTHKVSAPVNVPDYYAALEDSERQTPVSTAALLAVLVGLLVLCAIIWSIGIQVLGPVRPGG